MQSRVRGIGSRVWVAGPRASVIESRASIVGPRVWVIESRVSGFGSRVWIVGSRGSVIGSRDANPGGAVLMPLGAVFPGTDLALGAHHRYRRKDQRIL